MNKLKRFWSLIIAFTFTLLLSVPLSSCGNTGSDYEENTEEVDNPKDENEHPEGEHPEGEGEHPEGEGEHPDN